MSRKSPKFGTTRWVVLVTLVVMLLAGIAAWSSADTLRDAREQAQRELAARNAQSTAREIVTLLGELRRSVRTYVEEHPDLLKRVAANPLDTETIAELDQSLHQSFPDHYAYSLTAPDGQLLIDDFGEAIGDLCRDEIARFNQTRQARPQIHPGPGAYHFDLMVPWPTEQGEGTFFLSFRPERVAEVLAQAQLPGRRLLLTHADQSDLIEVDATGARDKLAGAIRLSTEERARRDALGATHPVADTGWVVNSIPEEATLAMLARDFNLRLLSSWLLIGLAGGTLIGTTLWAARRQRAFQEQQRLDAAVFNSAQEGIAITALNGTFLRVNRAFTCITEYEADEVIGQTPKLLHSGRHPPAFYAQMWQTLRETGFWHGEIWNRRKSGEVYLEWLSISTVYDESGQPVNYVSVYTDISRIPHAQSQLEHMAQHDALTDLPNRVLLQSRLQHALERARRTQGQVAVLYLDLDRFKAINDTFGHAAGDELLQQVAQLLSTRLRQVDTAARLGGDEFVVVVEDLLERSQAAHVAEQIIVRLTQPFALGKGIRADIGVSIGIALYPEHDMQPNGLLEKADIALYQAKEAGGNTFRFFDPETLSTAEVTHPSREPCP